MTSDHLLSFDFPPPKWLSYPYTSSAKLDVKLKHKYGIYLISNISIKTHISLIPKILE